MRSFTMSDDNETTPQPSWSLRNRSHDSGSTKWPIGKRQIPKAEIVFFAQAIILFTIIVACIFNLSRNDRKDENVWIGLLSTCMGVMLPNPKIKK